jgi:hypothetical protein
MVIQFKFFFEILAFGVEEMEQTTLLEKGMGIIIKEYGEIKKAL